MDDIRELAISGARKICGLGTCHHGYDCGNSWNTRRFPLHGPETTCPLAKYKVEHDDDPGPFYLRSSSERFATRKELFALCHECDHAAVAKGAAQPTVVRADLNICCDCPVKSTEECMDELEAES